MPDDPLDAAAEDHDEQAARERAIVEESIAAIRGEPSTATDHQRDRRRVRTVIAAIEDER